MSVHGGTNAAENGVILYLDAANIKSWPGSGTVWYDLSNRDLNANVTTQTFNANNQGVVVFNNDVMEIGTNLSATGDLSVFLWVKFSAFQDLWNLMVHKWFSPDDIAENHEFHYSIKNDGSDYKQNLYTTANSDIYGTETFTTNTWYNIGFTLVNNDTLTFYKNGKVDSVTYDVSRTPSLISILALGDGRNSTFGFYGDVGTVSIYNRALTADEVRQNFNALRFRFGFTSPELYTPPTLTSFTTLLHYDAGNTSSYPGSGTTVTDLSGNGYTGTLQNGTAYDSANGGSFSFDGVNDKISLSGPALSGSYTVFMWIYPIASDTYGTLFGDNIGNAGLWIRGDTGNKGKIDFYVNVSGPSHLTNFTLDYNTWNHFALVVTPTSTKFYKNGVVDTNVYGSLGFTPAAMGDDSASESFQGKIALVKALTPAATSADVLADFNANKTRFGF